MGVLVICGFPTLPVFRNPTVGVSPAVSGLVGVIQIWLITPNRQRITTIKVVKGGD